MYGQCPYDKIMTNCCSYSHPRTEKKRIIAQFFALCTLEHIVNTVALKCKQKQNLDLVG